MVMKLSLKLSLGCNFGLALVLVSLWVRTGAGRSGSTFGSSAATAAKHVVSEKATVASNDFSWSQVESSDYRVYVANLRRIGCPRQTIEDIIRADVHGLYCRKRNQLGLAGTGSGAWSLSEEVTVVA